MRSLPGSGGHGEQVGDATIVFDAKNTPGDVPGEEIIRGLCVRYALGEEADDLIERLIKSESVPKRLVVVSSDHRIKDAGRRRGCVVMTSEEYLDWLDRPKNTGRLRDPALESPEKPETESPNEAAAWLDAFRDVPKRSNR